MPEHADRADRDVEELADELDSEADRLEQRRDEVDKHIGDVREDWEQKQADPGVPTDAPPPETSDA